MVTNAVLICFPFCIDDACETKEKESLVRIKCELAMFIFLLVFFEVGKHHSASIFRTVRRRGYAECWCI